MRGAGSEGGVAVVSSVGGRAGGGVGVRAGLGASGIDIIGFGLKAYPNMANIKPKAVKITVMTVPSNVTSSGKYCGTASKRIKPAIMKHIIATMYNP